MVNAKKEMGVKIVLRLIAAYHIILGLIAFFPSEFSSKVLYLVFNMNIEITPQLQYFGNLLGIYMFIFGIFMFIAAKDPKKNKSLIIVGMVLYVLRVLNRIIFAGIVTATFGVSTFRTFVEVILLTCFGLALYLLRPKN